MHKHLLIEYSALQLCEFQSHLLTTYIIPETDSNFDFFGIKSCIFLPAELHQK